MFLPKRRRANSRRSDQRRFPGHCAWVRGHQCSVPGCDQPTIECAHVRTGSDGGIGLKPSDQYTISLCREHHAEQHRIGEPLFEKRYGMNLVALARQFAERSPHLKKWRVTRRQLS
jgi:hypothetical protein